MGSKNVLAILFMREKQFPQVKDFEKNGWDIIIVGEGNYLVPQEILKFIANNPDQIEIGNTDEMYFRRNESYV